MDPIIEAVLDAAARDDRAALVQLLHPYLHWTSGGRTIRGRNNVFVLLAEASDLSEPESYELRDGQIYRWSSLR
ncbi:nuclear transport factor 2 family protein [Actinoplanes sp. CA-142083]|uniref:nuclear transport factor 2 family protein n=1 Tax=Actinoplanes sp. CA-142083 TaxID=3239903 RepID=UPI003D8A2D16